MRRLAFLPFLLLALPARAQEEEVGRPFWVSTPPGAAAALAQARAAVSNEDWTGAARALQQVFDRYPYAFARNGPRYQGARLWATRILASAPPRVREEYERLFGPTAEETLRQALAAGDREEMLAVVRQFEGTRAGYRALLLLADDALARGRPAEARLLLRRIDDLHPEAAAAEGVRSRLLLAASRDAAEGGPAPGHREEGGPALPPLETDAWPCLLGNAQRNRVAEAPSFHERQWTLDLDVHERMWDQPPQPNTTFPLGGRGRLDASWEDKWAEYAPVHPVLARGVLVVHDGRSVTAANPYTGDVLWRYPESVEVELDGRTNVSTLFSPVVADGVVYAPLEVHVAFRPQQLQNVPIIYYLPQRRLVALDLETGEVLWRHDDDFFDRHPQSAALKGLSVTGVPVVRGDRLYAGANYNEGTYHNFLVAVDRHTGRLAYTTRISNGQQELNLFGRQLQECVPSPVTEADGVLYYTTNLGILAAVDALLGAPLWAAPYPILDIPSTYYWFEAPRRWPRFENGPPLVSADTVVAAPTDSTHLMAFDRRTGALKWMLPSRIILPERRHDLRLLQAADRERVYVSGRSGVLAIWLVRDEARGASPGEVAWDCSFLAKDAGAGRGVLAENGLWIPGAEALYRIDPLSGKLLGLHDRADDDFTEQPLNLVWGDGVLVGAARQLVWARFDEGSLAALARERIRSHPDEVGPLLSAADIHLATDQVSQAIEHYRRAKVWAEARGLHPAAVRAQRGLHRALLRRAAESLASAPARAGEEFEAAIRAAPDDRTRLRARQELDRLLEDRSGEDARRWRLENLEVIRREHGDAADDGTGRPVRGWVILEMAELHVGAGDDRRALAVLHELLEANPESEDGRQASRRIRDLLEEKGRATYETYERRAKKLFQSALLSGDLEGLARGLKIYANAEAAVDASLELARRQLRAGDEAAAVRVLQGFLVERPASDRVPEAVALMVEALHRHKSYGAAYAALLRLKTRYADRLLPRADGARVPARAFADEWLQKDPYRGLARSARRRDLSPDVALRFEKAYPNASVVDVPDLLGERPEALPDAVVLRTGTEIRVLDAGDGSELYRADFDLEEPQGPLVFVGERLYAVTTRSIRVFDARTGRALRKQPIPGDGRPEHLLEHRGQVFLLYRERRSRGRVGLAALHPEEGTVLWSRLLPHGSDDATANFHAVAHGDRLLLFRTHPVEVTVIDPTSGAVENRIEIETEAQGSRWPVPPLLLPDGRVLLGLVKRLPPVRFDYRHSYSVTLLDPASPPGSAVLWRYTRPDEGENRYLQHLSVTADHVAAVDEARGTAVIELATGTESKWEEKLPIAGSGEELPYLDSSQPRHDSLLLVLTRSVSDAPARISAYEVPDLRPKYSIPLTDSGQEMPRLIEAQGVIAVYVGPRGGRAGQHKVRLFDPVGARLLLEIVLPVRNANWVNTKVQNGILLVTTSAGTVYAYGSR